MSQPLEYSNLPPQKRKPIWIGAPITIGVVVSGFAYLVCRYYYRDQGLQSGEGFAIWFGLLACFTSLTLASINLRREIRTNGFNIRSLFCMTGIGLGLVLIVCTIDAYYEIYGVHM